jgi:hypothetical protein
VEKPPWVDSGTGDNVSVPGNGFVYFDSEVPGTTAHDTVTVGFDQPLPPALVMTGTVTQVKPPGDNAKPVVTVSVYNGRSVAQTFPNGRVSIDIWQHGEVPGK